VTIPTLISPPGVRIAAAVEGGRLSVKVRVLADERDRKVITGWVQPGVLAAVFRTGP
jgi:hypothetical protein